MTFTLTQTLQNNDEANGAEPESTLTREEWLRAQVPASKPSREPRETVAATATKQNLTDWRAQAACHGCDTDVFFIGRGEDARPAKVICAQCPVRRECLDWGLRHEKFGVWGGESADARERMRARRGIRLVVPGSMFLIETRHGTSAGYQRHRRAGTAICVPCQRAHALTAAVRKARRERAI